MSRVWAEGSKRDWWASYCNPPSKDTHGPLLNREVPVACMLMTCMFCRWLRSVAIRRPLPSPAVRPRPAIMPTTPVSYPQSNQAPNLAPSLRCWWGIWCLRKVSSPSCRRRSAVRRSMPLHLWTSAGMECPLAGQLLEPLPFCCAVFCLITTPDPSSTPKVVHPAESSARLLEKDRLVNFHHASGSHVTCRDCKWITSQSTKLWKRPKEHAWSDFFYSLSGGNQGEYDTRMVPFMYGTLIMSSAL